MPAWTGKSRGHALSTRERLNWLDRSELERMLEDVGIACYEHETNAELREAIAVNIEDGTIPTEELDALIGRRSTDP